MKTVSLELSKQLKEAGYPQEPGFRYCGGHDYYENPDDPEGKWEDCKNDALLGEDEYCETAGMTCDYFVSSPTADEILDVLPLYLKEDSNKGISFSVETCGLQIYKSYDNKKWVLGYSGRTESDESLADAAARMYLYLKKEGLI